MSDYNVEEKVDLYKIMWVYIRNQLVQCFHNHLDSFIHTMHMLSLKILHPGQ